MKNLKRINWKLLVILVLLFVLVPCSQIFATTFISYITVINNSTSDYTYTPVIYSINNTYLVANGYCSNTTMLDVTVKDASNTTLAFMPADDRYLFVAPSLLAESVTSFTWSSGNSPATSHEIIVGDGGNVTTPDNADLEPLDSSELTMSLYINDEDYTIFDKLNALRLDYNHTTDILTLTVGTYVAPTLTLTANNVTSGLHIIKVTGGDISSGEYESASAGGVLVGDSTCEPVRLGQSWTATSSYLLTGVKLKQYTINSISRAGTISLYATLGDYPTGGVLASATYDPVVFTTDGNGEFYTHILATPIGVTNGVKYVWVNTCTGNAGDSVWNTTGDVPYPVGKGIYSTDGGVSWNDRPGDYQFINLGGSLISLYVDDMDTPVDYDNNVLIPDNGNDWIWYPDPYINYIKLETSN